MKAIEAALCSLTLFFLCSCQRELGEDPLPIVNSPDSIYLSRYYELTSANDTPLLAVFSYDNQKRLTEIRASGYLVPKGSIANFPFYNVIKRYYTGTDTLPYAVSFGSSSTPQTYLFYDANGWIVKDSSGYRITTFTHLGSNNFMSIRRKLYVNSWAADTVWPSRTLQNGNFIAGFDSTLTNPGSIGFPLIQRLHTEATYDSKPNPFSRLNLRYPTSHEHAFWAHTDYFFPRGINNPLTYKWHSVIGPADVTKLREYTYTYNSRNLPVTIKATENGSPMFHYGFFEYTAL
ncbi:MAG: hypothetical protein H7Y42_12965 [Chitinophagaceae bacterium]|nr:hypothetical protein [Chitinophagaceae bacterium]